MAKARRGGHVYPRISPITHSSDQKIDLEDLFSRVAGLASFDKPPKGGKLEYNFAYETHDGAIVVTKQKFTHKEFEKFVNEVNIENWEPIDFTGTLRL